MIAISDSQYERLGKITHERFYQDLLVDLRQQYPDFFQDISDDSFLSELKVKEQAYLFNQKGSIEFVAEYMIVNGTDFDKMDVNPDIYELLQRNDLDGDEKIDNIYLLDLEHSLKDSNDGR
jgi:hypothetical protein